MAKTEYERKLKIKMKRLRRKKNFFEQVILEQQKALKGVDLKDDDAVKEAMQKYIAKAGKVSLKENREKNKANAK